MNDAITLTKLTVNLVPRSVDAVDAAAELSGDSRTDTVNRALQLYAHVLRADAQSRIDKTPMRLVIGTPEDVELAIVVINRKCGPVRVLRRSHAILSVAAICVTVAIALLTLIINTPG